MSVLLTVAVVLLALVSGLALWQRRQQVDRVRPAASSDRAAARRAATPVPAAPGVGRIEDADFGLMTWDGEMWAGIDDVVIAGEDVALEIAGPASGPDAAHRAVALALLASAADIDARARPMVVAELQRRGCPPETPVPYEASVGLTEDGRVAGWLWYCFGGFAGEVGVRSEDHWRTLELDVVE